MKLNPTYTWIGLIVGLLGMSVILYASAIIYSMSDQSFALEPDYEMKAANYDAYKEQLRTNEALGWMPDLRVVPIGNYGECEVQLNLFDRYGKPVREATVDLKMFHNARASNIKELQLKQTGDGFYQGRSTLRRKGNWEIRLTITRQDTVFTHTVTKYIEPHLPTPALPQREP